MIKIVFFALYPGILSTIEQASREQPESGTIRYEVIQDYHSNTLEQVEADVVITGGSMTHTLKCRNTPYAELKSMGYDVMKAINQCMQEGNTERAAVVGVFNVVYGAEQMCHSYPNLELGCYAKGNETKLEMAVYRTMKDGNQTIVGGHSTVRIAEHLGVPAVMIHSGTEAVNYAISRTIAVTRLTRHERQKGDEIANIMNYSFQGIISINRKGIIILANTCYYTCMRDRKISLAGEHIGDFLPDIDFGSVIRGKQKILSEVYRFRGKQVLVNCVSVAGDSEEFGYVFTFQGTEQVQTEEEKLRKRMYSDGFTAKYDFSHMLYKDSCAKAVVSQAVKFSYSGFSILIHGETGTRKELFAQSIHNSSRRGKGSFVAVSCAALSESLLENELFGYMEGAFTGASKGGKMGFFEITHEGTIFLDEADDISLKLRSRLLRVIQERETIRLGNDMVVPIDVRVICATSRDLKKEAARGNPREDLLYRLGVLELNLPPLRGRKQGILYLADRMMRFEYERIGSRLEAILQEGRELLMRYGQPGNVKEMHNFCECICIFCGKTRAGVGDVLQTLPGEWEHEETTDSRHVDNGFGSTCFQASGNHVTAPATGCRIPRLKDVQRQAVENVLELCGYHRSRATAYLGIDKNILRRKVRKYGIEGQADNKEHQV